ncbi:MAG: (d)CMP kinase [Planctomycetes bacterium]|nr:(d)CMP kinase [Planctomycetota bacterium]
MIITIDGPAGSGKSTAARKLAAHLEIPYLDTGAMYRAIAHLAIEAGIPTTDQEALVRLTEEAELWLDCGPTHTRVQANGHDVSEAIRTMAVSQTTSPIARIQQIREILVGKQRAIGRKLGSFVTEGRDQGSVVFKDLADVRFVVDADIDKRAERRYQELLADGEDVSLDEVRENLSARDANDCQQWAPLLEPGQSIRIDTTSMTLAEVVECLESHIKEAVGS